jgi:hypothetical protein
MKFFEVKNPDISHTVSADEADWISMSLRG